MHHTLTPSLDSIAKSLDSVGSLGEYGEPGPDPAKFIEDGSFIGEYSLWVARAVEKTVYVLLWSKLVQTCSVTCVTCDRLSLLSVTF